MIAALLCVVGACAARHPDSHSSSRVVVAGARVEVEILCQTRSLAETLHVDADGDERLDAAEFEQARALVTAYLREHYRVEPVGAASFWATGAALEIAASGAGSLDEQRVLARFTFEARGEFAGLVIHADLFAETNPYHRDSATLLWNDDEPQSWLFGEGVDTWNFEPAAMRRPYGRRLENVNQSSVPSRYFCTCGAHLGQESPPVEAWARSIGSPPSAGTANTRAAGLSYELPAARLNRTHRPSGE